MTFITATIRSRLGFCRTAVSVSTRAYPIQSILNLHHKQAKLGLPLVGAMLLFASMVAGTRAQDIPPLQLQHFRLVDTVKLDRPDTLLLAGINQIDIGPAGEWLVTDQLGDQVLLFDSTGVLQASLDPSICHPGFRFKPEGARFGSSEFIFIVTYGNYWGYRFTPDGQCLGSVDLDFTLPRYFDIDPAGKVYGAFFYPGGAVLHHMSATGKTIKEVPLPLSKYPNAANRLDTGGLVADGAHIFYTRVPEPEILKLSLDGSLLTRISKRSSWFRDPPRDLPADVAGVFAAMKDFNASIPSSLFELTDQLLMIQYTNRERGTGYQVFTKDGTLVAEELGLNSLFVHGANGRVYRAVQPRLDAQGELPNPYVEVYEFVDP